jgi:hypothetical protein
MRLVIPLSAAELMKDMLLDADTLNEVQLTRQAAVAQGPVYPLHHLPSTCLSVHLPARRRVCLPLFLCCCRVQHDRY